jgi:hypothetical protein
MPRNLIAAPFLGQHLLLRPGNTAGMQLPRGHFGQLRPGCRRGRLVPALAGRAGSCNSRKPPR